MRTRFGSLHPRNFLSDANVQIFGIRRNSPTFVQKEKKKVHRKPLIVKSYYVGRVQPHSSELLAESRAKLLELASKDKERMMLEEAKNKVESYIYKIKNKLTDDEEAIEMVSTKQQREEAKKLAEAAEEWLYEDGYSVDLATMEDKYAELAVPFEKILLRLSESTARPKAVEELRKKLTDIEGLMAKWVESKPQVTEEERVKVLAMVEETRKWVEEKETAQLKKKAHEEPAFVSYEVPLQVKPLEAMIVRLDRKPPPKVEKKKSGKNETANENSTATDANSTAEATENKTATFEADAAGGDDAVKEKAPKTTGGSSADEPAKAKTVEDDTSTELPAEGVADEL